MELEFSIQIFEKYSNINFRENLSSGSRVVPFGQTDEKADRHDEANDACRNIANTPKKGFTEVHLTRASEAKN
jgi:hypothetical protein